MSCADIYKYVTDIDARVSAIIIINTAQAVDPQIRLSQRNGSESLL